MKKTQESQNETPNTKFTTKTPNTSRYGDDSMIWAVTMGHGWSACVKTKCALLTVAPVIAQIISKVKCAKQTMVNGVEKIESEIEEWAAGSDEEPSQKLQNWGMSFEKIVSNKSLMGGLGIESLTSMQCIAFLVRLAKCPLKDLNSSAVVEQEFNKTMVAVAPTGALAHRAYTVKVVERALKKKADKEAAGGNKSGIVIVCFIFF